MAASEFLLHLLSFLFPAFALAVVVGLASRLVLPRGALRLAWWANVAVNFFVGAAVLAGGLWYFGRDGKMATYAALVVAVATAQWLTARAWRA